jgi:hypothetical protein
MTKVPGLNKSRMESGVLMKGSKITLDIHAVLDELNLSIEKLEESNVLDPAQGFQGKFSFSKSFGLLPESYSKEMNIVPFSS